MKKRAQEIHNEIVLMLEERFSKVNNKTEGKNTQFFHVGSISVNKKEHSSMLIGVELGKLVSIVLDFVPSFKKTDTIPEENYSFNRYSFVRIGYGSESEFTTEKKIKQIKYIVKNIDKIIEIIEKTILIAINKNGAYGTNIVTTIYFTNMKINVHCYNFYSHEYVIMTGSYKSIKLQFNVTYSQNMGEKRSLLNFCYSDFDKVNSIEDIVKLNNNK